MPVDGNLKRPAVLAMSLIAVAVIGMVPFRGWLITLGIAVFGFGTMTSATLARWSSGEVASRKSALSAAAAATPEAL